MTPAERVAEASVKCTLASIRLKEALSREEIALEELKDAYKEVKEELEPCCKDAAEASNKANDALLDANLEYDAAFKAVEREKS